MDDPAVRGRCVRLNWRTFWQNRMYWAVFVCLFVAIVLLDDGYAGHRSRYSHRYRPPVPELIPYGYAALAIGAGLLLGAMLCQNYCLLDPVEHRLYSHFSFLLWRKRCLVFREGDVLGVTVESQSRRGRYGIRWYYRMAAVGKDGRQQTISNWRRNGLEKWNARAHELAPMLGCQAYPAPEKSKLTVARNDHEATIFFD
jgi:hypothetical protein